MRSCAAPVFIRIAGIRGIAHCWASAFQHAVSLALPVRGHRTGFFHSAYWSIASSFSARETPPFNPPRRVWASGTFGMGHVWWPRAFNQALHSGLPIQLMASAALLKPVMCSCWPSGYFARMYQSSPTLLGSGSNLISSVTLAIRQICARSCQLSTLELATTTAHA